MIPGTTAVRESGCGEAYRAVDRLACSKVGRKGVVAASGCLRGGDAWARLHRQNRNRELHISATDGHGVALTTRDRGSKDSSRRGRLKPCFPTDPPRGAALPQVEAF